MTDARSAYDDQLPWLEAVDDEDGPRGVSARRMVAALAVVLAAALLVAGTFYWLGRRNAAEVGLPELIRAEPGPYKVRPQNPGGLDVAGQGQTAYVTSAGEDPDAKLALPEQTVTPPEPKPTPPAEASEPVRAEPEPKVGGAGSVVQLGAFANRAQAERAWSALSSRFSSVAGLSKMIVPYSGGIRLRAGAASPAEAREVCKALEAAGEACFIAN